MTGQMSNAVDSGAKAAREAYNDSRESIAEAGEAVRKAARDTLHNASQAGRKSAARAYDAAEVGARSVMGYVNEKPVQAALIGIGGILLASLLLRRR